MIDPDAIALQRANLDPNINIKEIPTMQEMSPYNLMDDKDYKKYIKDVKSVVRKSYEYRQYINYLRDNMDMDKCAFLYGVSNHDGFDIKIEIHHYPFSLEDIVEIVVRKRQFYQEDMSVFMVAKEVMSLHYKMMIGLIPLSETVHELNHNHRLFIPIDKVMGRYRLFVETYKQFITPEQLETLSRIEEYTMKHSDINDSTIIEQNRITYRIDNPNYQLPQFGTINDNMIQRLHDIKANNYLLPVAGEIVDNVSKIECPVIFH
jgi:hypothetical protein